MTEVPKEWNGTPEEWNAVVEAAAVDSSKYGQV